MRIAATWVCVKIASPEVVSMPSFIKIKLLPQMAERSMSKNQFWIELFTAQKYGNFCEFQRVRKDVEKGEVFNKMV